MLMPTIIGVLVGMVLAQRFKVLALFPVIVLTLFVASSAAIVHPTAAWTLGLITILMIVGLQLATFSASVFATSRCSLAPAGGARLHSHAPCRHSVPPIRRILCHHSVPPITRILYSIELSPFCKSPTL